jgi:glycosyltransferase involved in cell wall biosynthesis
MWGIADVGLLTSDSEGMPLSVIEAQMCGVPVVATDVGSVSEIVEDGVTGKLVLGTPPELAAAISNFVESPSTLQSMGEAAKKRARKLFSREVMVNRHLEVYEEILGKVSK